MEQNSLENRLRACFDALVSKSAEMPGDEAQTMRLFRDALGELGGAGAGSGGRLSSLMQSSDESRTDAVQSTAVARLRDAVDKVGRVGAPGTRKGLGALFAGSARKAQQELENAVQALSEQQEIARNDLVSLQIEQASAEAGMRALENALAFVEALTAELEARAGGTEARATAADSLATAADSRAAYASELREVLSRRHAALATSLAVARQTGAAFALVIDGRRRQLENISQAMSVLPELSRVSGLVNR